MPTNHLKELVHQMITLLAENKLDQLNEAEAYNRVINNVVIKTIDNSDHTTIIWYVQLKCNTFIAIKIDQSIKSNVHPKLSLK